MIDCEKIKALRYNKSDILQKDFYQMSNLNFMYDRKRLFSDTKHLKFNEHFPLDTVKQKLHISGFYLFAFQSIKGANLDPDFDIGFDNLDDKIIRSIITALLSSYPYAYAILGASNSKSNSQRIEKIKAELDLINAQKINENYNVYCIQVHEPIKLEYFCENIIGIVLCNNDMMIDFSGYVVNHDLKYIDEILNSDNILICKTAVFSNYNLIAYSKNDVLCESVLTKIEKVITQFDDTDFSYLETPVGRKELIWA